MLPSQPEATETLSLRQSQVSRHKMYVKPWTPCILYIFHAWRFLRSLLITVSEHESQWWWQVLTQSVIWYLHLLLRAKSRAWKSEWCHAKSNWSQRKIWKHACWKVICQSILQCGDLEKVRNSEMSFDNVSALRKQNGLRQLNQQNLGSRPYTLIWLI